MNHAIPDTITVGTVTYTISTDPDEWMRHEHSAQRKGDYGFTNYLSARILINPDQTDDVRRLTLWHEVMHAVIETIAGSANFTQLGDDKEAAEESVVRTLEHGTLAVLRDNPALVGYLTS